MHKDGAVVAKRKRENAHLLIFQLFLGEVLSFARSLFASESDFGLVQLFFLARCFVLNG